MLVHFQNINEVCQAGFQFIYLLISLFIDLLTGPVEHKKVVLPRRH